MKYWIGYRIEKFLFLFIKCRHNWQAHITPTDLTRIDDHAGSSAVMFCNRCDKITTVYIYRDLKPCEIPSAATLVYGTNPD